MATKKKTDIDTEKETPKTQAKPKSKSTTKKTKAVVENAETTIEKSTAKDNNVADKTVAPVSPTPTVLRNENKAYQSNDLILCESVRCGSLQYIGKKSGNLYVWSDYGDSCYVEYGDLLSLYAAKSEFITAPWFIIKDEELAKQWKLNANYEYFDIGTDIEDYLNSNASKIRNNLETAPAGFKDLVVYTAGRMIRNGTLDSLSTIRAIDDVLGINLSMLAGGN